MFRIRVPLALATLVIALFAAGCNQNMTFQMMGTQPKYLPYSSSDFFQDGQSGRPGIPDTLARGHLQDDPALFTGKVDGADVTTFPYPVTRGIVLRGRERYNIYCAPCHAQTGMGNGMIVQRGFTPPPTFHQDRLRNAPVGHFFDVITNGFGSMPSYAVQVPVNDRWAIIAYIRALQLSQDATFNDVPADQRSRLGGQ